jgi:hypothetical protein
MTKQFLESVNTPDYDESDWIIDPDMSAVDGVPVKYWKISGNIVSEMNQDEKAAYDSAHPAPIKDVSPRQMRSALILSGVSLESIDAALNTLSEPTRSLARTEWEFSLAFQRNRPLVNQVGQMLGWTSAQLDQLWIYAGTL